MTLKELRAKYEAEGDERGLAMLDVIEAAKKFHGSAHNGNVYEREYQELAAKFETLSAHLTLED